MSPKKVGILKYNKNNIIIIIANILKTALNARYQPIDKSVDNNYSTFGHCWHVLSIKGGY